MAATYEPIATTTLGSAASSITFSSIPSTYTDLKVIAVTQTTSAWYYTALQFNGDTGSNYSWTSLYGDGTSAASSAPVNRSYIAIGGGNYGTVGSPNWSLESANIFSYTSSAYKTVLGVESSDANGSGAISTNVGLWRNTATITSITVTTSSSTFASGSKFTLYGIKSA